MKHLIFLLVVWIVLPLYSSENLIIKHNVQLKPGIYRNFEEFKYNRPSIPLQGEIVPVAVSYGHARNKKEVVLYSIRFDETSKSPERMYGFCDGKNVFINPNLPQSKSGALFYEIQHFDRYCFFEETKISGSTHTRELSQSIRSEPELRLLDIKTGDVLDLDKKTLRKILSDDKMLLDRFNSEKDKEVYLMRYLNEYCLKHRNDPDL